MANYTKDEIRGFEAKDLRISKLAIVKSLIEKCSEEDVYEVNKITELAEKYINYVYEKRNDTSKRGNAVSSDTNWQWEQIAQGLNIAIPNSQNIKILNQIADEYKKAFKAIANPDDILVHIINTFGRYPTETESVSKVVQSLNLKG